MEAGLSRKESKRDENEHQTASEEGIKGRKHRRKRDGKRKKKRSSVPNLDDGQYSETLGQDNHGLDHDESVSVNDQANTEVKLRTSVDMTSQEGSKTTLQDKGEEVLTSRTSQQQQKVVGPSGEAPQGIVGLNATLVKGSESGRTEVVLDNQVGSNQGATAPDQGLRRRATLTEIGKSFDEDQEVRY